MDISKHRKEFTVFTVHRDPSAARSLAENMQAVGYIDSRFFPTLESALAAAREELPHVVLLDMASFSSAVDAFLIDLRALSPEILTILITSPKQAIAGLQFVARNLAFDRIVEPFSSSLELVLMMDRAALRLFYQFESEQLRERFSSRSVSASPQDLHFVQNEPAIDQWSAFDAALERFCDVKDLDSNIQVFLDSISRALSDTPVLYFRHLDVHASFLLTHTALLPLEKLRGIGVDLKHVEDSTLAMFFEYPEQIPDLQNLLREVFKAQRFCAFTHFNDGEPVGIVVALCEPNEEVEVTLLRYRRMLDLSYKRNILLKERHALEIVDPSTGVFNRRHFQSLLDDEIARARRLQMPVSLLMIGVDQFKTYREGMGQRKTEMVMKAVAHVLGKTARANDIIARYGPGEFVCLLPHTSHLGAAVKAERIRKMIEATKIGLLERAHLSSPTLSCGVAEYPTLSSDADSLVRAADEALYDVRGKGGNKTCLATTSRAGHSMDFVPLKVPSSPRPGGRSL